MIHSSERFQVDRLIFLLLHEIMSNAGTSAGGGHEEMISGLLPVFVF